MRTVVMRQTSNHGVCAKSNGRNRQVLLSGCAAIAIQFASAAALAQDGRTSCPDTACAPAIRGKVLDDSTAKGARIAPNVEQEGDEEAGKIPFSISVDGEPVVESGGTSPGEPASSTDKQRRTDVGLSAVDIQVKFDGLDARPILNVSTVPIRRSYRAGDTVRFLATSNYPAFIRRAEVRIIAEDEDISEVPVAVIPVVVNGEAEWVMPPSDKEEAKRYHYVLRVYDGEGRFDETGARPLARSARELPQEGKITDAPAPGMAEDNTALRNIPVSGGAVTVYGRNVPEGYQVHALDGVVPLDRNNAFVVQRILPGGDHDVDVSVRGTSKTGGLEFSRAIHIPKNDWFFIGLADLTVGKRIGDKGIESVREGEYDSVYTKGRVAFYLKGKIKGKYLLTAAADTGEDELKEIFRNLDDKNPREILRGLDPEDFYPVYGDDSTVFEDAPTKGKFYVRLDQGDSHVMWGNYKANIHGTEFLRSERALYGASAVYRSEQVTPFGERRTEATAYAAKPDTMPQRDEFLGTGGSAYFLKRQDVTEGSETITVEIRDQVTGQVIERQTLVYGEDYTIDYMQGMLTLQKPLSSSTGTNSPVRDGALGGNKVYLVAQYEYTPTVGDLDGYVYGGRAQQWLNDKVRVGVTGLSEDTGTADQKAYGADIKLRHSDNTFLEAEIARSKGPGFGSSVSTDGGLTISDVGATGDPNRTASAWRLRGQLDLADITGNAKGVVGGYLERKEEGFSTLSDQISADQTKWGIYSDLELVQGLGLKLTYDDYHQSRAYDENGDELSAPRTKRKGEAVLSKQLDEHWKVSLGTSYTEQRSPLSTLSGKSGFDGERFDAGVRVDYERNEDESYYVFGQGTIERSGDIGRNDRVGVGAEYQLTDKIALEGEVSYGTHGVGGEAGITYSPTADDNYYLTYRLDPDRAFDYDRTYDLSGTDKGTLVFGARRKVNDMLSAFTESNYDLYGRRNSLARTYGVTYTPDAIWTIDGGVEIGRINDDTINSDTGLERSDFDRQAISLAVSHKDEERGINGRVRAEARFEDSEDGTRDANTYLVGAGLSWKTSEDWRALFNIDAVLADASGESSFRDGDYVEASIGYAYRPVDNDRFNALFKYTWLYDMPGPDQVSAVSGDEYGPAQRSHILSVDFTYDLVPWLSVGAKYGVRYSEVRERVTDGSNTSFSEWQRSTAHLGIIRGDLHIVNNWDALLEGRVMYMPEADTTDYGALVAVYRHVGDNLKLGVGYNFGSFSDDLRDLTLNDRGVFFNLVGTF